MSEIERTCAASVFDDDLAYAFVDVVRGPFAGESGFVVGYLMSSKAGSTVDLVFGSTGYRTVDMIDVERPERFRGNVVDWGDGRN